MGYRRTGGLDQHGSGGNGEGFGNNFGNLKWAALVDATAFLVAAMGEFGGNPILSNFGNSKQLGAAIGGTAIGAGIMGLVAGLCFNELFRQGMALAIIWSIDHETDDYGRPLSSSQ